jgi:hypothetical protein
MANNVHLDLTYREAEGLRRVLKAIFEFADGYGKGKMPSGSKAPIKRSRELWQTLNAEIKWPDGNIGLINPDDWTNVNLRVRDKLEKAIDRPRGK